MGGASGFKKEFSANGNEPYIHCQKFVDLMYFKDTVH